VFTDLKDLTGEAGGVVRIIEDRALWSRFRNTEMVHDEKFRLAMAMLDEIASDHAHIREALWNEVAKVAGYESVFDLHAAGLSIMCDNAIRGFRITTRNANRSE
jgi:hypothetical protein